MASASEIERIIVSLGQEGADGTYVQIKRVDDIMREIELRKGPVTFTDAIKAFEDGTMNASETAKRVDDIMKDIAKREGPQGVVDGFNALQTALSSSLADLGNMAKLTERAATAQKKLTTNFLEYEAAQGRKHERNKEYEAVKAEAKASDDAYNAGLSREKEFNDALRKENKYNLDLEKKQENNRYKMEAKIGDDRLHAAMKREKEFMASMRAGHDPTAGKVPRYDPPKRSIKEGFGHAFAQVVGPKAMANVSNASQRWEEMAPIMNKLAPPALKAAAAIGAVAIAGAGAAVWAGKEFGGAVIDAQKYREDIETAFQTVERARMSQQNKEMNLGKNAAQLTAGALSSSKKLLSMSNQIADDIGVSRDRVSGQTLDFTTKGFDPKEAKRAILSIADLGTIDQRASTEGGREGLTKVMGKIKATGRINMDVLSELNTFGQNRAT
jgi:hypothetical protein